MPSASQFAALYHFAGLVAEVIVADGQRRDTAAAADAFLARDDRNLRRNDDVGNRLCVGGGGVIRRDINHVAFGRLLRHGRNVVGIRESVFLAGDALRFQLRLHNANLIGAVRFRRAVEQRNRLRFREQLHNHVRLTVQRGEVARAGNVDFRVALPVADFQRRAVVGNRRAKNRNIRRRADRRLKRGRRVRHNQVNIRRHKAIGNHGAGSRIARSVLLIKNNLVAKLLRQRVTETLGRRVQRLMLHQLQNADVIRLFFRARHRQAGQRHTQRQQNRKHLLHTGKPPSNTTRFRQSRSVSTRKSVPYPSARVKTGKRKGQKENKTKKQCGTWNLSFSLTKRTKCCILDAAKPFVLYRKECFSCGKSLPCC